MFRPARRRGEASSAPPAARQPSPAVVARRWRFFRRKRSRALEDQVVDSPASITSNHTRLQVRLVRPERTEEWGWSLVDDDADLVLQYGGVPVSAVAMGSPAAAAGVNAGDLIESVAGRKVSSLHGFKSMMVNAILDGTLSLSLSLLRPPEHSGQTQAHSPGRPESATHEVGIPPHHCTNTLP